MEAKVLADILRNELQGKAVSVRKLGRSLTVLEVLQFHQVESIRDDTGPNDIFLKGGMVEGGPNIFTGQPRMIPWGFWINADKVELCAGSDGVMLELIGKQGSLCFDIQEDDA